MPDSIAIVATLNCSYNMLLTCSDTPLSQCCHTCCSNEQQGGFLREWLQATLKQRTPLPLGSFMFNLQQY
jgi:hypothetical protein